ncbi:MAG: hypothetical protein QXW35_04180 [Candidatus Aenigmatarchaeota archaeon]
MESIVELTLKEYVYLEWIKQNNGRLTVIGTRARLRLIKEIAKTLSSKRLLYYEDLISKEIEKSGRYFLIDIEFKNAKFLDYKIVDTLGGIVKLRINSK